MADIWYGVAAAMLTAWVVLDGYDFGAGVLTFLVAKSDTERRQVLAAIGPFWDGNEVWLVVSGGVLLVAFPKVLSAGISGFYLAIFIVLWCLILRGISIELRSHLADPVWRASWDVVFAAASSLLPLFLGAALGNLLRGLPLGPDGWFSLTLFTDFSARDPVGILDWYTLLVGLFALAALSAHGAAYLAWKTSGAVEERSRQAGRRLFALVGLLWALVTAATIRLNPSFLHALSSRLLVGLLGAIALAGYLLAIGGLSRGRQLAAFLGSSAFLAGLSLATAACSFPVLLRARGDDALSLTTQNAGGDPAGLRTALVWLSVGVPLAVFYFVTIFRLHRGKAAPARDGEGY